MPLSSVCFGSSFLLRASKSRRPSFEAKIACSMLMVPTFVPVAPVVAAPTAGLGDAAEGDADADGAAGDAAAGDDDAGDADALFWARAATETVKTRARRILTNLLVIGRLNSLENVSRITQNVFPRTLASATRSTWPSIGRSHTTGEGAGFPSASRRILGAWSLPRCFRFQGMNNCIIRTALAQRQTSRTNSSIPYTLESLFSERRCDRESESLARLPQKEISRQRLDRLLVGEIPCSARRKHVAGDWNWGGRFGIEPHRIEWPI